MCRPLKFCKCKLVIRLLTIKRAWAVWTLANMSFNNTLNTGFSRSTSGKITRKIVSKRSQFTEELCQRISGTQIECRRRQRIEFDRRNVVTALSSFPYENLRKIAIFYLLKANQHRGLYIALEFSTKKTRIDENIVASLIFYFFSACRHTYEVLLAAAGFSQAELKYLTRHDSLKELEWYMTHITPELKAKKTRSGVLH